jgi:hypothetical protein
MGMKARMPLSVVVLLLSGCATHFSRGTHAYDDGVYPEAVDELTAAEPDLPGMSQEDRTRYALYRGLAHLALGDMEQAERWLAESKALWDSDRHLLDDDDRGRLLSAWQTIGHAPGAWGADVLRRRGM